MRLTILRHASAGNKREWTGRDALRPLDADGERSAEHIAKLLADYRVRRLVSSPTTRCIQTFGPLAELCDLPIELWDGLGPDADPENIVRCFAEPAFADAVFCTHGEVVSPLLDTAAFRTLMRDTGYSRATMLTKGTAWRLRLTPVGGHRNLPTGGQYEVPVGGHRRREAIAHSDRWSWRPRPRPAHIWIARRAPGRTVSGARIRTSRCERRG